MHVDSPEDVVVPAPLPARITVAWSKPRCWHGDKVTIRVRTQGVADGRSLRLQVFVHGRGADNYFDQIAPQPTIASNAADVDYTLNWKTKLNPPYPAQIDVKASVPSLGIDAVSESLLVDLIPPLHSA